MRIIFFILLFVMFCLCVVRLIKLFKKAKEDTIAKGEIPPSPWFFVGIIVFGLVVGGGALTLMIKHGPPDYSTRHPIEKYTFKNHTLSFDVASLNASYEVSLPLYVDIKPNDKVDVKYFIDRGRMRNITGVFVNDKAVHDGSYQLTYKEITIHR